MNSENVDNDTVAFISTVIDTNLNQGDILCLKVSAPNESYFNVIYTFRYVGSKQIYPIRQKYTFGVPHLESTCVCDCPGGENHCSVGYNYKNCTKSRAYCVTTYHPHQKATGCLVGKEAELCCDITVRPYKDWLFEAVQLDQPTFFGLFDYRFYVVKSKRDWILRHNQSLEIPLNRDHILKLDDDKIEVQIGGGKYHRSLNSGMYFYSNESVHDLQTQSYGSRTIELKSGVPVNEQYEWNTGKLGWFRLSSNGHWNILNGWLELQDAHHVTVDDCKSQKYRENYKAHYYSTPTNSDVNNSIRSILNGNPQSKINSLFMGHSVKDQEPWIRELSLTASPKDGNENVLEIRQIVVETKDSPSIGIRLSLDSKINFRMLFADSFLSDGFRATIFVDKFSNRFLNISFAGGNLATGTLIGTLFKDDRNSMSDIAFSLHVGPAANQNSDNETSRLETQTSPFKRHFLISVPPSISSDRYLCLYPNDKPDFKICKLASYSAQPLEDIQIVRRWQLTKGRCEGCNEFTWNSFVGYLNPKQWFDGVSSFVEALALAVEITFYIFVIACLICLCKKCLFPVLSYCLCSSGKWWPKRTPKINVEKSWKSDDLIVSSKF
uniref:Uncharacterized protein n=1 Tax=Romanomermis culicivorax TaxID=13658 RepID=A0A915J4D3_ROMCU